MSKIQIQAEMDTATFLQGAALMTVRELEHFIAELNGLMVRKKTKSKIRQEKRLLALINQHVLAPNERQRSQELAILLEAETISDDCYQELLLLLEKEERLRNERVKYMIELSQLKAISLSQVMQDLGLTPLNPVG
jgi:hypothetical protein